MDPSTASAAGRVRRSEPPGAVEPTRTLAGRRSSSVDERAPRPPPAWNRYIDVPRSGNGLVRHGRPACGVPGQRTSASHPVHGVPAWGDCPRVVGPGRRRRRRRRRGQCQSL